MRAVATVSFLALTALLTATCARPPKTNPVAEGEGEGGGGAPQCDADGVTLPTPLDDLGNPVAAVLPAGGQIDLSCIGAPPVLAQSAAVRVQGCIDIFGLGSLVKGGITVSVFSDGQNPGTEEPEFGEVEVAIDTDAADFDCVAADENEPACLALSCDAKGAYAIEGIPVHVPLTMKVSKTGDTTVIDTYSYGIVFDYQDNVAVDGVVTYGANLIYQSTWGSIPTLAGRQIDGGTSVGDGEGRAVIAGEIHDCNDKLVQGASVTTSLLDLTTKVTYFNGNASDPSPKLTALSTNTDGLYVVLNANTAPGSDVHVISAGILEPGCTGDQCSCVSLGSRTIRVFPDSVSVVTLRGDFPTVQ